jgi:hypothetical protein
MFPRPVLRWLAPVAAVLLLAALIAWWASPAADHPHDGRPATARPGFVLSYAAAADRLAGLDEVEATEQLRDWLVTGLAADLELDSRRLVGELYDTFPVRDAGFGDLARQRVGPGRALFADGVLNLIVPKADPHEHRTIGLLLDQYRTDAGADPPLTRVHRYSVEQATLTVRVESAEPEATEKVRRDHGYLWTRIDSSQGLTEFLTSTRALSTVEVAGDQVWAGGWRWPEGDGQLLTRDDVAVLQRGYDPATSDGRPGFSLDAGPVRTRADLTAAVARRGAPGVARNNRAPGARPPVPYARARL